VPPPPPPASPEHSAATILYALCREAGTPYHPPHGNVIQLHVDKETWRSASHWYDEITNRPYPPPPLLDPGENDDDPQTINANALDFLAAELHTAYEHAAKTHGWPTNPDSQTTWSKLPTANQNTMRQALTAMLRHLGIHVAPDPTDPRALPQHNQ
jgi:hypothetical protein